MTCNFRVGDEVIDKVNNVTGTILRYEYKFDGPYAIVYVKNTYAIDSNLENLALLYDTTDSYTKSSTIAPIEQQMKVLKDYLIMSTTREDWHAVWDAAIDLARLSDKLQYERKTK